MIAESRDAPGALSQWELDLILERIRLAEDDLRVLRARVDSMRPPDTIEVVRTAGNTRVRASGRYAVVILALAAALAAVAAFVWHFK